MKRATRHAGFTLLELLIAVAIFALLAAVAYGGLNAVLKTRVRTAEEADKLHELQIALSLMQRDLNQIIQKTARDEYGDMQPPINTEFSDTRLIEFTRTGWNNPLGQLRSTQQRVAYGFEDNALYREYWTHIYQGPQEKAIRATLIPELQNVIFRFQDEQENWHDRWPPLNVSATRLPVIIEVTLEKKDGGEYKRLFKTT